MRMDNIDKLSKDFFSVTQPFNQKDWWIGNKALKIVGSRLAIKNKLEFVGSGHWAVSVKIGDGKLMVLDRRGYLDEKYATEIFHTAQALSTLFPHNFPEVESINPIDKNSGRPYQKKVSFIEKTETPVKYPFANSVEKLEELGFILEADKFNKDNFIVGPDGGEYYVDTPLLKQYPSFEDLEKRMIEGGYQKQEVDKVKKSIEELQKLKTANKTI